MGAIPTAAVLSGFDLTDLDNFAHGFPHDAFGTHRREAPVLWHEPTEHTPDGEGFWSVATHAETVTVTHDPATYSSALDELARRVEALEPAGAPEWTRSNKHTGLRHVPLRLHRATTRS